MLNKQKIEAMQVGAIERDDRVRGLAIRAGRDGTRAWIWYGRVRDKQHKNRLAFWPETGLDEARAKAAAINDAIAKGDDPFAELAAAPVITLGNLIDQFLENARLKRAASTHREYKLVLNRVPAEWRERAPDRITRGEFEQLQCKVHDEHGLYAANHLIRVLKALFYHAAEQVGRNPCKKIELFTEPKVGRFLTDEEYQWLGDALLAIKASEPHWFCYFTATMTLGTRRSELLTARWENVDLSAGTITLTNTKNGKSHTLSLPLGLCNVLMELPSYRQSGDGKASGCLFPSQYEWKKGQPNASGHFNPSAANHAWKRICERAKIKGCRIHDLRHSFVSLLLRRGFGLHVASKAVNHSSMAFTFDRYGHLDQSEKQAAIESVAAVTLASPAPVSARPAKRTRHRAASVATVAKPQDAAA